MLPTISVIEWIFTANISSPEQQFSFFGLTETSNESLSQVQEQTLKTL